MEVPGVCTVCSTHGLVKTCMLCGKQVCRAHQDASSGACITCARRTGGTTDPQGDPSAIPPGPEDAGGRYT